MRISQKIICLGEIDFKLEDQPLTRLDTDAGAAGFGLVLFFSGILDERELIDGLKNALNACPYYAGRAADVGTLNARIVANNEGVLFTTAAYDSDIDLTWFQDSSDNAESALINQIYSSTFDRYTPLLQVKLSQFRNGSVLGFSVSHYLCDGHSLLRFARIWADSINGNTNASLVLDKSLLKNKSRGDGRLPSRIFPYVSCSDYSVKFFPMESRVFRLPEKVVSFIDREKSNSVGVSYQDVVMAFMWHAVTLSMESERTGNLILVHNVRRHLDMEDHHVGNLVCLTPIERSFHEVTESLIFDLAKMIRAASNELSVDNVGEHFSYQMGQFLDKEKMQKSIALFLDGAVLINNWSKFPIYELDFGAGKPGWLDIYVPMDPSGKIGPLARRLILTKGGPCGDAIDAYVVLPSSEMQRFGEIIGHDLGLDSAC